MPSGMKLTCKQSFESHPAIHFELDHRTESQISTAAMAQESARMVSCTTTHRPPYQTLLLPHKHTAGILCGVSREMASSLTTYLRSHGSSGKQCLFSMIDMVASALPS